MDPEQAIDFIRSNGRAVLHTYRRDGSPQLSPVLAVVDDAGRVVVSSRETAMKVKNLARDPRATLVALPDGFFGDWAVVSGPCEVVHLPEAMDPLVDYYRRAAGEHDDWDEYRAAMERDRRVLLRIAVEDAGPTASG